MPHPSVHSAVRVLLWAPKPPPLGGVGLWTERYLAAAAGHDVAAHLVDTAPPVGVFSEKSALRLDRAAVAVRALGRLAKALMQQPFDAAHVTTTLLWATPRDAAALAMARRAGVPSVLHIHASTQIIAWRERLPPPRRRLLDAALAQADVLAVLSEELRAYFGRSLPRLRVERVPNLLAPMAPRLPDRLPARTRPRVLFVGINTPLKGLGELAEAMLDVPAELVVVGPPGTAIDPVAGARMAAALARLRQTGRLTELGELTPHECQQIYREVDVFCLPSHREGLPNVVLEAMAAGLPVVATPVGGIPDVLTADVGRLTTVGDAAALAATLTELIAQPELCNQLGRAAAAYAAREFSAEAVLPRWRALYASLPQRRRPTARHRESFGGKT